MSTEEFTFPAEFTFPVEEDRPIPALGQRGSLLRGCPFGAMKVGDSFFVPVAEPWGSKASNISARLIYAKKLWQANHPDHEFTTRTIEEKGVRGVRCWRIR